MPLISILLIQIPRLRTAIACLFFGLLLLAQPGAAVEVAPAASNLSAQDIIERALRKAAQTDSRLPDYRYSRLTTTEELDQQGKTTERKEKLYEVLSTGEFPALKSMKINGRALSEAKVREEQARENRVRQQLLARRGTKREMTEISLTPELAQKYQFSLRPAEEVKGRASYVLDFKPRAGDLPVRELADRLLNQLSGKLWIDQEDFEIARADIHLQTEVKLWGGLLASLREVSLHLTRSRVEPGVWFNNLATGQFEGRKLFAATRVRTESETTNFRRVSNRRKAGEG